MSYMTVKKTLADNALLIVIKG